MINTSPAKQEKKSSSPDVRSEVLHKIHRDEVKQRSRSYHVLKTIVIVVGILFVFLLSVFIISFVVFLVRVNGATILPSFGIRGIGLFFASLPWLLILLAVAFIFCIELLSRRFSVSYKRPLLYTILGIVFVVAVLGFVFGRIGIHERLSSVSQKHDIPFAGEMYKKPGMKHPRGSVIGTVLERIDNGFLIETQKGETLEVHVSSKTHSPHGDVFESFTQGDKIIIMGKRDGDTIEAFGIHLFPPKPLKKKNDQPPPKQLKNMGPMYHNPLQMK